MLLVRYRVEPVIFDRRVKKAWLTLTQSNHCEQKGETRIYCLSRIRLFFGCESTATSRRPLLSRLLGNDL